MSINPKYIIILQNKIWLIHDTVELLYFTNYDEKWLEEIKNNIKFICIL